ncbi:docking protein 3 [Labrus mixtus]|uniref:docking protein 3 n=1 Tax=Labrus mixtus TaxID=508554 RepID=UPI0029C08815|nr:docking protein 3 [Labrus mixtus]
MEVIFKEGMLFLQGVKFGKRTWRKIWMMLFKPSFTGVGRVELYSVLDNTAVTDQKKPYWQKTPERKVVRLSDCLSVSPAPKESCPQGCTAFYLNTIQSSYTLASTASEDWLSALCHLAFQKDPGESDKGGFVSGNGCTMEDNDLYSSWKSDMAPPPNQYQVTVQSTEASRRCQLTGMYLVSPEKEAVILLAMDTGHTIYCWPYTLLRKFGQVEGGFSIEAGRRCESGEGLFVFLSRHGPQIFQAILKQCTVEKGPSVQQLSGHRRSLSDQSPIVLPTRTNLPSVPPVQSPAKSFADKEDESAAHYSTINDTSKIKLKQLSVLKPYFYNSKESVGEEDDDERCHSLDSLNLNNVLGQNVYCNLMRATPPLMGKEPSKPEIEDSESIYSEVEKVDPPSNPRLQPFSSLSPPVPLPPPCPLLQSVPFVLPKPRYQRQPPANNQPGYNAPTQPVDETAVTEEAISSSSLVAPSEPLRSFKHRLAEIISKDLAKFQPPLPPGAATFSQ